MVISDLQTQLESEQSSNKSSSMVKTLRMQLEDAQMNEEAAHKQHRRLQNDYDELQVQNDELMQKKMEVLKINGYNFTLHITKVCLFSTTLVAGV